MPDQKALAPQSVTQAKPSPDGPEDPLTFGGAAVRAIIPIPSITGNVTATFAATSYAGTLYVTVLSDPDAMTDAPVLAAALRRGLPHRDQGPRPADLSALT